MKIIKFLFLFGFAFISGILLFQSYHFLKITELQNQLENSRYEFKQKLEKIQFDIAEAKSEKYMIIEKLLSGHQKQLAENLGSHSQVVRVQMTAYTAWDPDSMEGKEPDGITSTGKRATPGRDIAVDPSVIPYGTKVFIPNYGFRTANDTGGAIKGKKIDILVKNLQEARNIGRQWITILVKPKHK